MRGTASLLCLPLRETLTAWSVRYGLQTHGLRTGSSPTGLSHRSLHLKGRDQEAMAEAVAAVDRNGGKNPEVIATWLTLANQLRR